jgi:hypothetical protein
MSRGGIIWNANLAVESSSLEREAYKQTKTTE